MRAEPFAEPTPEATAEEPPRERRGLKKGLYLIPSSFTAANVAMGFFAVMGSLRGFQLIGIGGEAELARAAAHFDSAAIAIGLALIFDMLDGRIARLTRTTTELGVQLDSLADVLTFGIAPAVLIYSWGYGSVFDGKTPAHKLGWFISFMYLICGAFRLARFNVQATRPRPLAEGTVKVDKKSFVGLPIPIAGGLLAAIVHFSPAPLATHSAQEALIYSALVMVAVALLGALMVSTIRYPSFKTAGTSRRSTRLAILAVAAIGMLLYLFSRYVLLGIVTAYVLYGLLARAYGLLRRRPVES